MNLRRRSFVRQRALDRCEYCLLRIEDAEDEFHVEHIIPRVHGGSDSDDNLACSCSRCNTYKGVNLTGLDPETGSVTALFNPRRQSWNDHFALRGAEITGTTDIGRTTVRVLRMNDEFRLWLRAQLIPPREPSSLDQPID